MVFCVRDDALPPRKSRTLRATAGSISFSALWSSVLSRVRKHLPTSRAAAGWRPTCPGGTSGATRDGVLPGRALDFGEHVLCGRAKQHRHPYERVRQWHWERSIQANVISDVGQEYCYKGIIRQISSIAS